MNTINEILRAMDDPQMRHSAIVHTPIVLSMVAASLALALTLLRGGNRTLRWLVLVSFTTLMVSALVAARSGQDARAEIGAAPLEARRVISRHEAMGQWVWVFAAGGVLTSLGVFAPRPAVARASLALLTPIGCATAGWVALVGHHGGTAVYAFGTGTPRPLTQADLTPPSESEGFPLDPRAEFFASEVHPILATNCMSCHGPGEFAASGLDMTTVGAILGGGNRGSVVVPGDAESSTLYQAAAWTHDTLRMPDGRDRLSDENLSRIKRWIDNGAVWSSPDGAPE